MKVEIAVKANNWVVYHYDVLAVVKSAEPIVRSEAIRLGCERVGFVSVDAAAKSFGCEPEDILAVVQS